MSAKLRSKIPVMSFASSKDRWQLGIVQMRTVEGGEEVFFHASCPKLFLEFIEYG